MSDNENPRNLTTPNSSVPTQIHLGPRTSMDLSWLSENERKALLIDYTKGMIDISKKAQELDVDATILKRTLDDLSATTREVSDTGNAVTISHTQTTKVGRTEVMMGNTEQAQSGKLSKSQTGQKDWTPYYIFGGILALILIVALMNS
ncbi:MAG: hypothetical protein J5I92_10760 [Thiogranum sp.]|nr:hypothetical protein [Thiogranum sp.]